MPIQALHGIINSGAVLNCFTRRFLRCATGAYKFDHLVAELDSRTSGYVPRTFLPCVIARPDPCPAEIVATEAHDRGFRRLALTGTKWPVDSDVYPEMLAACGLEYAS